MRRVDLHAGEPDGLAEAAALANFSMTRWISALCHRLRFTEQAARQSDL